MLSTVKWWYRLPIMASFTFIRWNLHLPQLVWFPLSKYEVYVSNSLPQSHMQCHFDLYFGPLLRDMTVTWPKRLPAKSTYGCLAPWWTQPQLVLCPAIRKEAYSSIVLPQSQRQSHCDLCRGLLLRDRTCRWPKRFPVKSIASLMFLWLLHPQLLAMPLMRLLVEKYASLPHSQRQSQLEGWCGLLSGAITVRELNCCPTETDEVGMSDTFLTVLGWLAISIGIILC